ncbi:MAG TPA: TetR/AcrR family transcriptional regulator, partial [Halanaerobiaceae bacterium]|nr:TetR/AcrR family transcriptional regulator [Halanaerobiaceae bacterium]
MPKIIDNIEQKIYENALSLFAAKGYNQVSMKNVAEASGIAVGTLYNYYSNK